MAKDRKDDKREESLREACAIGNFEAVDAYLNAGVNVNSKNNMNGWTALHWAVHRDSLKIARILLDWNADMEITNSMDKTPVDYVKSAEMKALLLEFGAKDHNSNDNSNDNSNNNSNNNSNSANSKSKVSDNPAFVPNYLLFPELIPAVSAPADTDLYPKQQEKIMESETCVGKTTSNSEKSTKIQVFIVRDSLASEDNVVGSVICTSSESFGKVLQIIQQELDDVPEDAVKWLRLDKSAQIQLIPISKKQYEKPIGDLCLFNQTENPSSITLIFKRC